MHLRKPVETELDYLSTLCLKSKAYWGYDADFIEACRDELTLSRSDLTSDHLIVAEDNDKIIGMAQVHIDDASKCFLDKLYVDSNHLGSGVGKALFQWAKATAKRLRKANMYVVADPNAAGFYRRMGAILIGDTPSGSIPGRMLPLYVIRLNPT